MVKYFGFNKMQLYKLCICGFSYILRNQNISFGAKNNIWDFKANWEIDSFLIMVMFIFGFMVHNCKILIINEIHVVLIITFDVG